MVTRLALSAVAVTRNEIIGHASLSPPAAMTDVVRPGHRGLLSGRGLYDWSRGDSPALVARIEGLVRHLSDH